MMFKWMQTARGAAQRSVAEDPQAKTDRAEQEKKRVFAILESMVEGVLVVDSEQKILTANSALVRYFDLDRHSVQGRYFWELFRDATSTG